MERTGYSERLKLEHELINRRVTWLLSPQTILFAEHPLVVRALLALHSHDMR
jgi:hypothetical protein